MLNINLFDNSGSVASGGGNDPVGRRYLEALLAIQHVGAHCRCGRELTATIHFDTPTSGDLAPTPMTKPNLPAIIRSLAIPPDGAGSSCLGPSFRAAQQLIAQHPDHRPVLVALTDFELFDGDVDRLLDEFIDVPGDVHAVVLRSTPPAKLAAAPHVITTRIDYTSQPGAVARAVFAALTATRPHARPLAAVANKQAS